MFAHVNLPDRPCPSTYERPPLSTHRKVFPPDLPLHRIRAIVGKPRQAQGTVPRRRDSNPRVPCWGLPAYQAGAINHSATPPRSGLAPPTLRRG